MNVIVNLRPSAIFILHYAAVVVSTTRIAHGAISIRTANPTPMYISMSRATANDERTTLSAIQTSPLIISSHDRHGSDAFIMERKHSAARLARFATS